MSFPSGDRRFLADSGPNPKIFNFDFGLKPSSQGLPGSTGLPGHKLPYECIGFWAMEVAKPYEFIGFGAMEFAKP